MTKYTYSFIAERLSIISPYLFFVLKNTKHFKTAIIIKYDKESSTKNRVSELNDLSSSKNRKPPV